MPTTYNRATLSTFFQQNDVPQGSDYENLIYSQVNIVDTSAQAMAGSLSTTELITPRVSATDINVTGTLSIGSFSAANFVSNNLLVTSTLSASSVYAASVHTDTVSVSGATSANNMWVAGNFIRPVVTIAASGTTLATANILAGQLNRLTSVSDGTATGVGLLANFTGLTQYLYNETTTSANLWPCTGGQINALGSGAAFGLAGSTLYTIIHTKASGYAVK